MKGFVEKIEEKSLGFMKAHPKFTKYAIAGTTALATVGSSAVVASAEDESAAASGDVMDTVIDSMSSSLGSVASKAIPAAIGVGVVFVGVSVAWRWMKKMAK